jgi:alpha-mannosidase
MKGPQEAALPLEASFLQVDAPNVTLMAFKRAEDGDGYVLRLMETQGRETEVTVGLPHIDLCHAFETNLVEENQRLLTCSAHEVRTRVKAFGMTTIRLMAGL